MVADNDAGGITTYSVTGATYGYGLIWFLVLLGPIAYFVQEMTVRLGAVTKRGHAEAIFDAFGAFWGWFSLGDLALTDWLTLITEFIGMTAALSIFGIPPVVTVVVVSVLMIALILNGRYWTWEKIVILLCVLNLIYIPAALLVHPDVSQIFQGVIPNLPGGLTGNLFFLLMGRDVLELLQGAEQEARPPAALHGQAGDPLAPGDRAQLLHDLIALGDRPREVQHLLLVGLRMLQRPHQGAYGLTCPGTGLHDQMLALVHGALNGVHDLGLRGTGPVREEGRPIDVGPLLDGGLPSTGRGHLP